MLAQVFWVDFGEAILVIFFQRHAASVAMSDYSHEQQLTNHLIRRVCHAFLLPGHMPPGPRECRSLSCVVCQSFAVLCGQNEAIAAALPALIAVMPRQARRPRWVHDGPGGQAMRRACFASGQARSGVGHLDVFEEPPLDPELLVVHWDHMPVPGRGAESGRSGQFRYDAAGLVREHFARVQHEDALRSRDDDAVSVEQREERLIEEASTDEKSGPRTRGLRPDNRLYLLIGLQEPSRGFPHFVTDCHGSTSLLMCPVAGRPPELSGSLVITSPPATQYSRGTGGCF